MTAAQPAGGNLMRGAHGQRLARGLAWFGIGLGVLEILAPHGVARATGLRGHERLIQLFGVREVASGIAIVSARQPANLFWTRVVSDALDAALLGRAMRRDNPDRARAVLTTAAILPVVVLDAVVAFYCTVPTMKETTAP